MKKYFLLCLFFFSSFTAGHKIMTKDTFSEIEIGISEPKLKDQLGEPDLIKNIDSGEKEFEYIERVSVDDRTMEVRHYLFLIKDGKVSSKKMILDDDRFKPLLERNAYDLQTSSNDRSSSKEDN